MSTLYNATQGQFGSYISPVPGGSSNKGFYQQNLNIPFYNGRSILATIPEYQRNPLALERDLLITLFEGRANLMKILTAATESGGYTVSDVRFRLPIEVQPLQRIYLEQQTIAGGNTKNRTTIKIKSNTTKVATAMADGNPKQVGEIARLEIDQLVMMMFSWVEPRRTSTVDTGSTISYQPNGIAAAPVPELAKVVSIDYTNSTITVERQWAGEQRTSFTSSTTTIPAVTVVDNSITAAWGITSAKVPEKFAFIIPLARSMKEDEIDAKIRNYSNTFAHGILQRSLRAWGSQQFAEVVATNLGITSPLSKSKQNAIKSYYDLWEWQAIFGEKKEEFDPETGYWQGWTDGLLSNIPKSHYLAIKGIDYTTAFSAGSGSNLGTFHPLVFNKMLEGKAYIGSQEKVLVCGSAFYTNFKTMINFMTQNVDDIKSEWRIKGNLFETGDGLTMKVVVSDKMSLNGLSNTSVMYDEKYFKPIGLKNYPSTDIVEVNNENPLKRNGFIHGVKGWIDLNPDAHWVFTTIEKTLPDGTDNSTVYNALSPLGSYLG